VYTGSPKAALGRVTHRHTTSETSGQCRNDPATCTEWYIIRPYVIFTAILWEYTVFPQ